MAAWRWRRWSLGLKVAVGTFTLVTVAFVVFVGALTVAVSDVIEQRAAEEIREKTRLLVSMVDASDKDLRLRTRAIAEAFEGALAGTFELRPATIPVNGQPTPTLLRDGRPLNLDTGRVDAFTATSGAVATVFARTGDDFVRITTSLVDANGQRALGTLLDRAHPGYAAARAGSSYTGLATLFGRQYMTQYDPIHDARGEVVGLRFVGLDFSERLASLKDGIRAAKVGRTGYFYVLDARPGPALGTLIVHPASEGKNILGAKAPDGRLFIQEILATQDGLIRYPWINSELGETEPRDKLVAYSSFQSWGWVIGGGTYVDEYVGAVHRLRDRYAPIAALVVLLLSGCMYLLMRAMVVRPLGQVRTAAEALARGDLTTVLTTAREDEVGELIQSMNQIGEGLTRVVRAVRDSSETVATACTQIAQSNQDLSERTESQASALTETAASMDTLGAAVIQNASGATQANTLVQGASAVAVRGGALVTSVVDTMKGIDEASRQIADIIGVIDGIALQTNILALNAAVEAARAGAAGHGFAVVAAEVRTLAVRSAEAARQIKTLIDTSVARVAKGSTLVNQAGATMDEVVSSIRRVTHIMGDISAASTEQTANVSRVGSAVSQMDASTQQSAALVTQMAGAATSLRVQAEDLVHAVAAFKLTARAA